MSHGHEHGLPDPREFEVVNKFGGILALLFLGMLSFGLAMNSVQSKDKHDQAGGGHH